MHPVLRRKDRKMSKEFCEQLLDQSEYLTISMVNPDGSPYAVPISHVREGGYLYFHCAQKGQKIDCLSQNNQICFSCVGKISMPEDSYTVGYESCIGMGTVSPVLEEGEKIHALFLLAKKYFPSHLELFEREIQKSFHAVCVYKIMISHLSGKANRLLEK